MAQPALLHYDRGKLCEALERIGGGGRVDRLATAAFVVEAQAQRLLGIAGRCLGRCLGDRQGLHHCATALGSKPSHRAMTRERGIPAPRRRDEPTRASGFAAAERTDRVQRPLEADEALLLLHIRPMVPSAIPTCKATRRDELLMTRSMQRRRIHLMVISIRKATMYNVRPDGPCILQRAATQVMFFPTVSSGVGV